MLQSIQRLYGFLSEFRMRHWCMSDFLLLYWNLRVWYSETMISACNLGYYRWLYDLRLRSFIGVSSS